MFGLNCVLCRADRGQGQINSHIIFSLAIPVGNPSLERLSSSVLHQIRNLRITTPDHHAAGLQTSNGQTTSPETPDLPKRRSSGSSEMG